MHGRLAATHSAITALEAELARRSVDPVRLAELERSVEGQVRTTAGLDGRIDSLHNRVGKGLTAAEELAAVERRLNFSLEGLREELEERGSRAEHSEMLEVRREVAHLGGRLKEFEEVRGLWRGPQGVIGEVGSWL